MEWKWIVRMMEKKPPECIQNKEYDIVLLDPDAS